MENSVKASAKQERKLAKKSKANNPSSGTWSKFLTLLQELGKALQFPIAVLPFAAILNRFGALGTGLAEEGSVGYWISLIIQIPGSVPFDNLPLIFAIGTAFGLAKDHRGEVALVSLILYLGVAGLTAEKTLPEMIYGNVLKFNWTEKTYDWATQTEVFKAHQSSKLFYVPIMEDGKAVGASYVLNIGVLGGIVAGAFSAFLYNRLKEIKLPTALSFFGGRRFVPMVALASAIPMAFAFALVWPWLQFALLQFGNAVANPNNPAVAIPGTAIYGILNRLLLPFGLHQILNTLFWFQLPITGDVVAPITGVVSETGVTVNGDINAFTKGISNSGLFQAGFFPIMMGGLPMAAVAMIMTAKKEKRKEVAGFLGGVAGVSVLSGITEPLEFSFVFIAPLLLGIHAVLTGIFMTISTAMRIQIGFGFSAGLIDYVISFAQSWGLAKHNDRLFISNPLWTLVLAAIAGGAYYFIFYFTIKGLNIKTPGREDDLGGVAGTNQAAPVAKKGSKADKYSQMADQIIEAIGKDNLVSIDNCATRLRLILKDNAKADDAKIKAAGTYGVKRLGTEGFQIVVGPDVEHVANAMKNKI